MKPFNLEEYLKNPSRKVVTRDGLNARIICTDRKDLKFPIVALIETKLGGEFLQYYTKNGTCYVNNLCDADLLFLPEKHEGWARICFSNGEYYLDNIIYPSKADAKNHADKLVNTVAAVKIEWEE